MSEFLNMGGYALYVWGSYGAAVVIIGGLSFLSWRRLRASAARLETMRAAAPHRRRTEAGHGA